MPLCLPFSISGMFLEDLAGGTLVDALERQLGHALTTLRAVALEDQTFSTIAIARFGSRVVPWIEQEKMRPKDRNGVKRRYVDKVVPISGRHRQIIADEFQVGVERLIEAHQPYNSTARRPGPQRRVDAPQPLSDAEIALRTLVDEPKNGVAMLNARKGDETLVVRFRPMPSGDLVSGVTYAAPAAGRTPEQIAAEMTKRYGKPGVSTVARSIYEASWCTGGEPINDSDCPAKIDKKRHCQPGSGSTPAGSCSIGMVWLIASGAGRRRPVLDRGNGA